MKGLLLIPLTNLNDKYIDRPKLTAQKKTGDHVVPYPQVGSEL